MDFVLMLELQKLKSFFFFFYVFSIYHILFFKTVFTISLKCNTQKELCVADFFFFFLLAGTLFLQDCATSHFSLL